MKNNRNIVLFIATSLDGYIARGDGTVDWLEAVEGEGDNGYSTFYETIDTLIMGNKTYEQLKTLVDEFPYKDKICYVLSRKEQHHDENVQFINDVSAFLEQVKGSNIWLVGGAVLLDEFMKEDLVDEFIISVIPILLGKGIPLFKNGNPEVELELVHMRQFGQIAQLHYKKRL